MSHQTIPATNIVGTHVENWEDENLGTITDVMINKHDGIVAYMVLSYPGHYSQEWRNKRFAVPFEAIARKQGADGIEYILNTDPEFLKKAPGFDADNWPDFADPAFSSVIKDYYKDISVDLVV